MGTLAELAANFVLIHAEDDAVLHENAAIGDGCQHVLVLTARSRLAPRALGQAFESIVR